MYDNLWQFVTISAIYGSVCHFFTSLTTFDSYWQFWHLFPFCQYSILANFYYFSEKSYCTFFWETWTLPNIKEILQHNFSVGRGGDDGAGGVGDGGAQAEANNLAVIGHQQEKWSGMASLIVWLPIHTPTQLSLKSNSLNQNLKSVSQPAKSDINENELKMCKKLSKSAKPPTAQSSLGKA